MPQPATSDVADPGLAEAGRARIAWADRSMPVLAQVRKRFTADQPLAAPRLAAPLHVTAEAACFVRTLAAGGAQVALCASNPLSTQDDVAAALAREDSVTVYARAGLDRPGYYRHIDQALDLRPHLVFDDGCDLVNTVHTARRELLPDIAGGCEQTTTGVLRLHQMARAGALAFPMLAVDDSATKRLFDNRHGTGQSALDGLIRATNTLLAGATVVVAGYGACGVGIADRARGLGAHVVVTETDPVRALDAVLAGHRVLPMDEAAAIGEVFLTATGNRDVLRGEHFPRMRDGAILANAGHFDVEIDLKTLGGQATTVRRGVRPHCDEYLMPDGRRLVLVAAGRVLNLGAGEGHPAAVMDMAFADQTLAAAWLVDNHQRLEAGVYQVPAEIDAEAARLKLACLGVRVDQLTAEQREYLSSWQYGS